jgi:hypothetical protein
MVALISLAVHQTADQRLAVFSLCGAGAPRRERVTGEGHGFETPESELARRVAGAGIPGRGGHVSLSAAARALLPLELGLPRLPLWLTAHEAVRHTPRVRRVWDRLARGLRELAARDA